MAIRASAHRLRASTIQFRMDLDTAMGKAARWAIVGSLIAASLGFVEEPNDLLSVVVVHLSAIVAFGFLLTVTLGAGSDTLAGGRSDTTGSRFARAAAVVAIVTGVALVITLVSSSALGYEVSLQFLLVLSALDIAWVVAATYYGLRWRLGELGGLAGGTAIAVMCVWSIWGYLDQVGFTDSGGWLVDADALNRLVFPLDVAAAVIAVSALWIGARHTTAQRKPQS